MKPRLVIIDGVRTPFCKAGTDLARLDAVELGRIAVTTLLQRRGLDPALIDEVIFGCVSQPRSSGGDSTPRSSMKYFWAAPPTPPMPRTSRASLRCVLEFPNTFLPS